MIPLWDSAIQEKETGSFYDDFVSLPLFVSLDPNPGSATFDSYQSLTPNDYCRFTDVHSATTSSYEGSQPSPGQV